MSAGTDDSLEALAVLLRVAEGDDTLRRQLRTFMQLQSFQRTSLINSAVQEMTSRGEPADVRQAFALLTSDDAARVVLEHLSRFDH